MEFRSGGAAEYCVIPPRQRGDNSLVAWFVDHNFLVVRSVRGAPAYGGIFHDENAVTAEGVVRTQNFAEGRPLILDTDMSVQPGPEGFGAVVWNGDIRVFKCSDLHWDPANNMYGLALNTEPPSRVFSGEETTFGERVIFFEKPSGESN